MWSRPRRPKQSPGSTRMSSSLRSRTNWRFRRARISQPSHAAIAITRQQAPDTETKRIGRHYATSSVSTSRRWVGSPSCPEQYRIRAYWQAGVFTYRRFSSQLGRVHYETFCGLLESRVSHNTSRIFHYDQTSLAIAVRLAGLRWRGIHFDHNLRVSPASKPFSIPTEHITAAKIIHYHGFMWPDSFPRFLQELRPVPEEVRRLLEKNGPLDKRFTLFHRRLLGAVFRRYCSFRYRRFERSCRVI